MLPGLHNFLFGLPGSWPGARWHLWGFYGWLEAVACLTCLAGSLLAWKRMGKGALLQMIPAEAWMITSIGALARLSVPMVPYNWYLPVDNVSLGGSMSRVSSYMPLLERLAAFELGLGFTGAAALNIVLGTACIPLLWYAASRRGMARSETLVFIVLVAVTPLYVRLSASESQQITQLLLWCVAVLAFQTVLRGTDRWDTHAVLLAATMVACPIRLEGAAMMASVPLFAAGRIEDYRDIVHRWRRFGAYGIGLALGLAITGAFYGHGVGSSMPNRATLPDVLISAVPSFLMRVFGAYLPAPLFFRFPFVAIGSVAWFIHCLRSGRKEELAVAFGPLALLALPFVITGRGVLSSLPHSAYDVIPTLFTLVVAAQGFVWIAGEALGRPRGRVWIQALAALAIAPAAWFFVYLPYRWTYPYEEEFQFLERHLPSEPATIATVFDPGEKAGDYACCLSLPFPTFLVEHPNLKWLVLTANDADSPRLAGLSFDYYYPGLLTALDARHPDRGRTKGSSAAIEADSDHLERLKRVDAAVRTSHALEPIASSDVQVGCMPFLGNAIPCRNFIFPGTETRLTMFRAVR